MHLSVSLQIGYAILCCISLEIDYFCTQSKQPDTVEEKQIDESRQGEFFEISTPINANKPQKKTVARELRLPNEFCRLRNRGLYYG